MSRIIRYGTEYGGFYYPDTLEFLNSDSIIYCVGVGEDISHDVLLANKLNCNIYLFDPTPRAKEHVDLVKSVLSNKIKPDYNINIGGGDINYWNIILNSNIAQEQLKFDSIGVYTEDKIMSFYQPENPNFVSHSLINKSNAKLGFSAKVKKISTIMQNNNHNKIDLLKLDIEGVECEVINQMLDEEIYPTYLSVDFDSNIYNLFGNNKINECIKKILNFKYDIISNHDNNYSFLRQ